MRDEEKGMRDESKSRRNSSLIPRSSSLKIPWLREAGVFIAFLVLCVLLASFGNGQAFRSAGNLQNLSRQVALLGVYSLGEAIVIIAGGIDLSVGSLIGFIGMVCARMFAEWRWPLAEAIPAALVVALAIGIIQTGLIHYLRVPPFIVTLGSLSILRSLAQLMSNAMPIPTVGQGLASSGLEFLVNGQVLRVPVSVWLLLVLLILLELMMRCTRVGRYLYSIGSNQEAARLSGVPLFRTKAV